MVWIISWRRPCRNLAPVTVAESWWDVLLPPGTARVSDAALDVTDPPGCVAIDVSDEFAALFCIIYLIVCLFVFFHVILFVHFAIPRFFFVLILNNRKKNTKSRGKIGKWLIFISIRYFICMKQLIKKENNIFIERLNGNYTHWQLSNKNKNMILFDANIDWECGKYVFIFSTKYKSIYVLTRKRRKNTSKSAYMTRFGSFIIFKMKRFCLLQNYKHVMQGFSN